MTIINLEKCLIRENRKLARPKELLLINEYDKFTTLVENDALTRVGLNRTLKYGRSIKSRISQKKEQTNIFNQERVFHISQIQAICEKYYLRFLPTRKYRGIIDTELPNRISNFEIAYNLKCSDYNTRIVAPMESFELEKKPKDPLMFYEINDEYFYLIHKWGNDLSIYRSILPFLSTKFGTGFIVACIFTIPFFFIHPIVYFVLALIGSLFFLLYHAIWSNDNDFPEDSITFIKRNNWNSEYE